MTKNNQIRTFKNEIASVWKQDYDIFDGNKNIVVESDDVFFEIISFGNNASIRANKQIVNWCQDEFSGKQYYDIMNVENLYKIESKLREHDKKLMGENVRYLKFFHDKIEAPKKFDYKIFVFDEIKKLYDQKYFKNALTFKNDQIALVAFQNKKAVAIAAASNELNYLWQVGVDTRLEYRRKGLASYLVNTLASEVVKIGKTPYYTTWSANIASSLVALNSGFYPICINYVSN